MGRMRMRQQCRIFVSHCVIRLPTSSWVATSVILTIDVKSSAGIYKGSALNLWWLYFGMFTPDEYYNIVEFTGAGTRRDEVVEEIQQQQR